MTTEHHDSTDAVRYRHARDTSNVAPKPGHHLGTASFRVGDQNIVLWLVEGPENDAISITAMLTDFRLTRYLRFRVEGTAIEALNDLPFAPHQSRAEHDLEILGSMEVQPTSVRTIFSSMRAPNGRDPDAAIARFRTETHGDLPITITELRRGWEPLLTVFSGFLGLTYCVSDEPSEQQCRLTVTDKESKVQVSGDFVVTTGLRSSLAL